MTFNKNNDIVLATAYDRRVTARTITFANDGTILYFMSWEHNKKVNQIKQNSKVALCLKNLQIEGIADILGHPKEERNGEYLNLYSKKLSKRFAETFSNVKEMVLVRIKPIIVIRFKQIDNRFHLQTLNLNEEKANQMRIKDKDHPEFPY